MLPTLVTSTEGSPLLRQFTSHACGCGRTSDIALPQGVRNRKKGYSSHHARIAPWRSHYNVMTQQKAGISCCSSIHDNATTLNCRISQNNSSDRISSYCLLRGRTRQVGIIRVGVHLYVLTSSRSGSFFTCLLGLVVISFSTGLLSDCYSTHRVQVRKSIDDYNSRCIIVGRSRTLRARFRAKPCSQY